MLQQRRLRPSLDTRRLQHMAAAGLPCGLVCHYWYIWLDRLLPGRGVRVVLKKVIWDQVILSPVMWVAYFAFLSALKGNLTLAQLKEDVGEIGTQVYKAEWLVWPPAQVANFYFLPTRFRVLYDNCISLGFDTYISYLVNDQHPPKVATLDGSEPVDDISAAHIAHHISPPFITSCQPNNIVD